MAGLFSFTAIADEGMWLPQLLQAMNESDMQAHGLQLTAEDLYSVNNSSMKDAIVSLGGFCTAEMISSEGLMLTNHHCAFGSIQEHSSVSNDYLKDGFWAMSRDEELKNDLDEEFGEIGDPIEARINLAITYIEMNQTDKANDLLSQVLESEATESQKEKARKLIKEI